MKYLPVLALLLAALVVLCDRLWLRRTLDKLSDMLGAALDGSFRERRFDESRLSAIELQFTQYLLAGETVRDKLDMEKRHMQEMIADLSHQTKTPVANILLYADLLEEMDLPPDGRAHVQALAVQARKLHFLMESLVKAGRLETGVIAVQPQKASVCALMEAAVAQAAADAREKDVALTCESVDMNARFDPKWTGEALFNLVDNAVKYTPSGGTVVLRAAAYEMFCRIDVTDSGPGIAEEEQGHIFERFYRSPAARDAQGVGLGLYLAREIVSAGGGYLKVRAQPGEGSTFSIFLPRS